MSQTDDTQLNVESPSEILNILEDVSHLSTESLEKLESSLAEEFKQLSKKYLDARLARVNYLIDKINRSLKTTNSNDKNWFKVYNFELETINNIKTNTEDLLLMEQGLIPKRNDVLKTYREYEEELHEIFKNLQSPLMLDSSLNESSEDTDLPFPHLFDQFFKPHRDNLQAIVNEKNYRSDLIRNTSYGNSTLIWKRYHHSIVSHKQKLVADTYEELNQLYKDYHGLNQQKMVDSKWDKYYKSVVKIKGLEKITDDDGKPLNTANSTDMAAILHNNQDTNYVDPNNRYVHNNRVEVTNIKRGILHNLKRYQSSQSVATDVYNSTKRTKLNTLNGLQEDEIDTDIFNIRHGLSNDESKPEDETAMAAAYDAGIDEEEADGDDEEEDEDEDEDEEDEEDEEYEVKQEEDDDKVAEDKAIEEEAELRAKYEKLLGLNKPQEQRPFSSSSAVFPSSPFQYPALPPLENFTVYNQ